MYEDSEKQPLATTCASAFLFPLAPITVVIGHYGVGKTNFSINLALDAAAAGQEVTLVDLDVVNPYFRSSDYREVLEEAGVRVVAPVFAGTALDSPSLSGVVYTVIEDAIRQGDNRSAVARVGDAEAAAGDCGCGGKPSADDDGCDGKPSAEDAASDSSSARPRKCVIIDAGGDDVGATALGRFAPRIAERAHDVIYVVNRYRNLTQAADEAAGLLGEIEAKSGLRATAVVNNSHLKQDTTEQTVRDSTTFAHEVAEALGLPLVCTAVPKDIVCQKSNGFCEIEGIQNVYPVQVYVRTPWGT